MVDAIVERAHAKINLYLHLTGRRPDGYHLLDSLFVYVELADILTIRPAADLTLAVQGPFAAGLAGDDNLVGRAARRLGAALGIAPSGAITLDKEIPLAAGLGGGSADAAAMLRVLPKLWRREASRATLEEIALRLGADVPAALDQRPVYVSGIGELRRPAARLPEFYLALANPGIALPTAAVFKRWAGMNLPFSEPLTAPLPEDFAGLIAALRAGRNDLETAAMMIAPEVGDVLKALAGLPGCRLARMSGSGGTCFGVFERRGEAEAAALSLAVDRGWWSWAGGLVK